MILNPRINPHRVSLYIERGYSSSLTALYGFDDSLVDVAWGLRECEERTRNEERAAEYEKRLKAYRLTTLLTEAEKRIGPFR